MPRTRFTLSDKSYDVVRNVVSIRPGNSRTEFDGHRLGGEGEIVDFDFGCAGGVFEAGQCRQRAFQSWHKVGNGNDGGSRPPPRGSHRTRAAVLQSAEEDGDTGLDGFRKNVPNKGREPY